MFSFNPILLSPPQSMSRQSSLVEDRISSDEDEFQEERSGTLNSNTNNRLYPLERTHSTPPIHVFNG